MQISQKVEKCLRKYYINVNKSLTYTIIFHIMLIKVIISKGKETYMELLGAVLLRYVHPFIKALRRRVTKRKRRYREVTVLCMIIVLLAVVVRDTGGFTGGGKSKVYAIQGSDVDRPSGGSEGVMPSGELQVGLMGIVSSVGCMEKYSQAISSVELRSDYENILAGTSKVKRGALNRLRMSDELKEVERVGYYALMKIRNNQMAYKDYDALLRIVEAEATGGDLKSKILIANVVMNRVNSAEFPDTIYDVVFQYAGGAPQFSPVGDGRIYSVEITNSTVEAVERALSGEDYSEGALFFMARADSDHSSVAWFDSKLKPLFAYGGHEYFKFND